MADPAVDMDVEQTGPVTLQWVMQTMIAEGLRAHYQPPRRLSHELFVLLLQMKEQEGDAVAPAARRPRSRPKKRPVRRKPSTAAASPPP